MDKILEIKNVKKYFKLANKKIIKAVDDISFDIKKGETLGLVGESGCGKTTLGKIIMGIYKPERGQIIFFGKDIHLMDRIEYRNLSRKRQMIFQDGLSALNPRMTVKDILEEGMEIHKLYVDNRIKKVVELLEIVGLTRDSLYRYPHEFSIGQAQRIGIARALALDPKFIILDEPISSLDVSIQAQIINLLLEIQRERNLSYLLIGHDLDIVRHMSDRIAIMKSGKIVELSSTEEAWNNPNHPYTKMFLLQE